MFSTIFVLIKTFTKTPISWKLMFSRFFTLLYVTSTAVWTLHPWVPGTNTHSQHPVRSGVPFSRKISSNGRNHNNHYKDIRATFNKCNVHQHSAELFSFVVDILIRAIWAVQYQLWRSARSVKVCINEAAVLCSEYLSWSTWCWQNVWVWGFNHSLSTVKQTVLVMAENEGLEGLDITSFGEEHAKCAMSWAPHT